MNHEILNEHPIVSILVTDRMKGAGGRKSRKFAARTKKNRVAAAEVLE